VALGAILLAVALIDLIAPWPYVMTPLYAIPVLLAAHLMRPRGTMVTTVAAATINLGSGMIQGTPVLVLLMYTVGLALSGYLATMLAYQRRETERHAAEAERAQQQLEQFIAMIAHDLRNPLTAMMAHLQLLEMRSPSARMALLERTFPSLQNATRRMRRLVDDLLDTAQLMSGQFRIHPVPTDLVVIARAAVELRQASPERHPIVLEAPDHLEGNWDPDRIGQVVANLLTNAIKYSPPEAVVRVVLEQAEGQCAAIRIADRGAGIPREQIPSLFAPFARLEQHRAIEGSGLGLHIVQGIVDAHGGQVIVESELGQGSTFTVLLPRAGPTLATPRDAGGEEGCVAGARRAGR